MISAKRFLLIVLTIGLIANFYIAYSYKLIKTEKIILQQQEYNKKLLEKCHAFFNFNTIFTPKISELFSLIEGKNLKEMDDIYKKWCKSIDMPQEAFKIIVFNVPDFDKNPPEQHIPLNVKESEKNDWKYVMDMFDAGDYKSIKRVVGKQRQRLIKKLVSSVGVTKILRRNNIFTHIGTSDVNTYAIWFKAKKKVANDRINAAIFFAHRGYIKSRMDSLAKIFFSEYNLNKERYGYFNSIDTAKSYLPNGLSAIIINDILNKQDIKNGFKKINNPSIYTYRKPNGNVFIAINKKPFVHFPTWAISLPFFWLPIWFYYYKNATGNYKLSLKTLSGLMFLLVILQPVMLITNYWEKLLESKSKSIKEEKINQMFNELVQLDTNETEISRIFKKYFKNIMSIMKKSSENPKGADNPERQQKFIDETMKLEIDSLYDVCLIFDENGKAIRDYATTSSFARTLALYPKQIQEELLKQYAFGGWTPFDGEIKFLEDNYREKFNIKEFISIRPPQGTIALVPIVKAIISELIYTYNKKHNLTTGYSTKKEISSGMLASMMGGKSDEYLNSMFNSLGDYFKFGYSKDISYNYIDLLYDKEGKAKYGIFLFSGIYNYTRHYLLNIFKNQTMWPKNTEYLAITDYKLTINYPYVDLWQRLDKFFEIMQPPINQYYEEVNINGEPHILCAYNGNKIVNYIILSYMPISAINKEINEFELKMLIVTIIAVLIIGFIIYKIYLTVISPTKTLMSGVSAINSGEYNYRIVLKTNDEWERLAYAYNQSLESMKELKIATFIQDTILPAGRIKSGLIQFAGKTISADGIGGDYFDAFTPEENQMMFLFGDVSGHSISAALVVSMAHAGFASLFDSGIREPSEILKSFSNLMLTSLKRVKMMTCFSGFIDEEGNMKCSNAGQTFPLIVDDKGNVTKVSVIGYPLGSAKRAKFKQDTVKLPDRCRIVLYSDGMIEAMNSDGEPFGYDRFEELVKDMACNNTIEEFRERIYKELHNFSDPVPWNDDCSIAVVDYIKPNL